MSDEPTTVSGTHTGALRARDAVPRALELADAAAERGQYAEALGWLQTLEASRHQLDAAYADKRVRWRLKVEEDRTECSQWFG
ncbi:MAG TPA: hypothetical protein VLP43_06720 [Solirubrobacteraceae bacterium]|nr:hypothetical protein [Solirubrobacteraceae bacterium]